MNPTAYGLKDEDLTVIKTVLTPYNSIEKAVIFGSRATGNYKQGSDVDIAIYAKDKNIVSEISFALNEATLLPYHFDIIDYYSLTHQNLINQINETGKVFYKR
jgi:predicted nucleotidyltransferase